jgi:tape measure domain-containing protein
MAITLQELVVKLGLDDSDYQRGLQGAQSLLDRMGAKLTAAGATLTAGVTLPLAGLGAAALSAAVDMDALKRGLATVATSSDTTASQLKRLTELAKLPGLGLREVTQASVRLQQAGYSAASAERSIKAFGNALAAAGGGRDQLNGVIRQLQQMQNKPFAMMQDLRIIMDHVPQVAGILNKAFGTIDTETLRAKGVTATQVVNTIVEGLEKIPSVTGGIKNSLENFSDTLFVNMSRIGESIVPIVSMFLGVLTPAIEKAVALFLMLPEPVQYAAIGLAALAAAVGPLMLALGGMSYGLSSLIGLFTPLGAGAANAVHGFQLLTGAAALAGEAIGRLGQKMLLFTAGAVLWEQLKGIGQNLMQLIPSLAQVTQLFQYLGVPVQLLNAAFATMSNTLRGWVPSWEQIKATIIGSMGPFGALLNVTKQLIAAKEFLTGKFKTMDDAVKSTVTSLHANALASYKISDAQLMVSKSVPIATAAFAAQAPVIEQIESQYMSLTDTINAMDRAASQSALEQKWFDVFNAAGGGPSIVDAPEIMGMPGDISSIPIIGDGSLEAALEAGKRQFGEFGNVVQTTINTKVKTPLQEFQREVSKAFDHMARGMANAIVEWRGFGETLKSVAKSFLSGILEISIQQFLNPLQSAIQGALFGKDGKGGLIGGALSGLGGKVGDWIGGALGGGNGVASTVANAAGSIGGTAAKVGGGLLSTLGSVGGIVGGAGSLIGAGVSAVADRKEGTLNAIEHEVRYSQIHLLTLLELANTHWPALSEMNYRVGELLAMIRDETFAFAKLGTPSAAAAGVTGPFVVAALVADDSNMETFADRLMDIFKNRGLV